MTKTFRGVGSISSNIAIADVINDFQEASRISKHAAGNFCKIDMSGSVNLQNINQIAILERQDLAIGLLWRNQNDFNLTYDVLNKSALDTSSEIIDLDDLTAQDRINLTNLRDYAADRARSGQSALQVMVDVIDRASDLASGMSTPADRMMTYLQYVLVGTDLRSGRTKGEFFYARTADGIADWRLQDSGFDVRLRDSSPQLEHAVGGLILGHRFGILGLGAGFTAETFSGFFDFIIPGEQFHRQDYELYLRTVGRGAGINDGNYRSLAGLIADALGDSSTDKPEPGEGAGYNPIYGFAVRALMAVLPDWLEKRLIPGTNSARDEASPLVFDLDGDGIEMAALGQAGSVYWDIDNDGFREASAWVKPDDGLLVLDRNNDGRINDHSELFGTESIDGFTILSQLDSNGDDRIDAADAAYVDLRIWRDLDGDGESRPSELFTLAQLGIVSISLADTVSNTTIAGNRVTHVSSYTMTDGTTRGVADVWFQYDNVNAISGNAGAIVPDSILALPELRGYGATADLSLAMMGDAGLLARVQALVGQSATALLNPAFDFDGKFRALLWDWAGVDGVNANGRGRYIDGRDLAFLERITDRPFDQRGSSNPAVEAATTLINAMEAGANAMLFRFFAQTHADSFITGIQYYQPLTDEVQGTLGIDFAKLNAIVAGWQASGATLAQGWATLVRIIDGALGLEDLSSANRTALEAAITASDPARALTLDGVLDQIFPNRGLGLNGTAGNDTINGGTGADTIDGGSGNDTLNGRGGHDRLDGGNGDDTLNGETGDDTLLGGAGNDTYVYTTGLDTIRDSSGSDVIRFSAGVTLANLAIRISPTNEADAQIYIDGVLSLIVEDMFTTSGGIETWRFADGSSFDARALTSPRNGTSGNDTLTGTDAAIFPHDYLYGLGGDDRLTGGLGDDRLFGGDGSDTYVVTSGSDRIQDSSGAADRIEFGAGYLQADMLLTRVGANLIISFNGVTAATINGQFSGSGAIEQLVFADGSTFNLLGVRYTLEGTAGRDTLNGIDRGGGGDILLGRGGDDSLYAYSGDDDLDGGDGNDYLDGGAGNDRYIRSAGYDVFRDTGGVDRIDLGAVAASRVALTRDDSDLIVAIDGVAVIRVDNQFTQNGQIESLVAAGGQVIDLLTQRYVVTGTSASETIYGISFGGSPDDQIYALEGNDRVYGGAGNDLLDGGDGNDTLEGGAGNDVYYVGSGSNSVSDRGLAADTDTIYLPDGVNPADVTLSRTGGGDLLITWGRNSVIVDNAYDPNYAIERLGYANGIVWNLLTLRAPTLGSSANDTVYGNSDTLGPREDSLFGFAGNDRLYGYDGADLLDGGEGDDELYGSTGADSYRPGQGNNIIIDQGATGDGADRIILPDGVTIASVTFNRLADGDLLLTWSGGSVRIDNGLDQNSAIELLQSASGETISLPTQSFVTIGSDIGDSLYGNTQELGGRNDQLYGFGGDDYLDGQDGDDRLDGGAGNDELRGGTGADSYYVGTGNDFIRDSGSASDAADRIYLPSGIAPAGVAMWREYDGDIVIQWSGGSVRIDNGYDLTSAVEQLRFADGIVWNITERAVETIGSGESGTINGNREELGSRNDVIRGLGGDDSLYGYDGNDILDGGEGDDELYGATGGDTYIVGFGWDFIQDSGASGDAPDVVKLGRPDLRIADLAFAKLSNGDIRISWSGGTEGVILYRGLTGTNTIEFVELADGTRVSLAEQSFVNVTIPANQNLSGGSGADTLTGGDGNDTINGLDGNDTLEGGAGNDSLYGGNGADIYRVGLGNDYISDSGRSTDGADRIELMVDVTRAGLTFNRLGDGDLLVRWTGGSVRIDNALDLNRAVETLVLKDGSIIDLATVPFTTIGTTGAETLGGNQEELGSRNDDIRGLDGDDTLNGYDGDDRLDGGAGDDKLYGSIGNDVYVVQGNDAILDTGGADRLILPSGVTLAGLSFIRDDQGSLTISWSTGSVLIDSAYDLSRAIETLVFADGSTASLVAQSFETRGSAGNDSIDGNREEFGSRNDVIRGLGGNDALYGFDGDDTLDGGPGDDALYGAAGADRYIVSGNDYIEDAGATGDGADRIILPSGARPSNLVLTRLGNGNLVLDWGSGSVQIFRGLETRYAVELVQFADGSTASLASLPFVTRGTNASETIYGNEEAIGSHADTIFGADGNDTLRGRDGDDRLVGGAGNDRFYGETGADTYVVGDGDDYIAEYSSNTADGPDTIELPVHVALSDLSVYRLGNGNLVIEWSSGSVQIEAAFDRNSAVEQLRFANGNVVQLTSLPFETRGSGENQTLAGNREELGSRNDIIRAMGGDDTLYGYDGNDTLDPGAGDDLAVGGAGDDLYLAGPGDDIFAEGYDGGGNDTISFASDARIGSLAVRRIGTDLEFRWDGNSILLDEHFRGGGYAFEAVRFGPRASIAIGTLLNLSANGAAVAGVATNGDDTLVGTADANQLSGLFGSDLILGGDGTDRLDGGDGDDLLYGGDGADLAIGGPGNDLLDGGTGLDQLYGGLGNDTFYVDQQGDLIFENANQGTDTVISTSNFYLYSNIENLTLAAGSGNIFGVGNDLANTILGNQGANTLLGGGGADTVRAGAGIDIVYGEAGNDQLFGDAGNDFLAGGAGDDTLDGGSGGDSLYGEDGNDTLIGGSDFVFDQLVGGNGDDVLRGDSGLGDFDYLYGNAGNDSYYVDTPADLVFEQAGEGTDTVYANITGAGYYLYANIENLVLLGNTPFGVGNDLANRLTGNAIGNFLLGGAGNDILNGKAGNDVLFGEAGADTFVFERGTGGDVIGDFLAGTDKIDLSAFGFANFAAVQAVLGENAGTSFLYLGNGDLVVLNGVARSSLSAGDFILTAGQSATGIALEGGDLMDAAALVDVGFARTDLNALARPVSDHHDWLRSRFTLGTLDFDPALTNGGPLVVQFEFGAA